MEPSTGVIINALSGKPPKPRNAADFVQKSGNVGDGQILEKSRWNVNENLLLGENHVLLSTPCA